MEYRLVKVKDKDNYLQIYREEDSQLLGSAVFDRRWLLFRQLSLRLGDEAVSLTNGLLRRRRWTWDSGVVSFGSKMLGRNVTVFLNGETFVAEKFVREKMELHSKENGRTGLIINPGEFSADNMVLIQHFDRFDLRTSLIVSALVLDQYDIW